MSRVPERAEAPATVDGRGARSASRPRVAVALAEVAVALAALVVALAGCTCGPEGSGGGPLQRGAGSGERAEAAGGGRATGGGGAAATGAPRFEESAGGLAWRAEEPLLARRPTSSMRAAEYAVRDAPDAELTVFHFGRGEGGSVDENLDRWIGQIQQPDGRSSREVAEVERTAVAGLPLTTVDVSGAYAGMAGMGGGGAARPGWRLLGAIVEGPDGLVFFKLTGPADALESAAPAFRALVESIHPL